MVGTQTNPCRPRPGVEGQTCTRLGPDSGSKVQDRGHSGGRGARRARAVGVGEAPVERGHAATGRRSQKAGGPLRGRLPEACTVRGDVQRSAFPARSAGVLVPGPIPAEILQLRSPVLTAALPGDHPLPLLGGSYLSVCDLPEARIHPFFGFPTPRGTSHEASDTDRRGL